MAVEQSVVGVVAAGLEHIVDMKPTKEVILSFVGEALQLEQRNTAMNNFIGVLVDKLRNAGIYTLLVKGQGVAQCYERPHWRAAGDIDLFLSWDDYKAAKKYLSSIASVIDEENPINKHQGFRIKD